MLTKIINRIPQRDRKKYGVLIGMFAVGMLLWGRLLLKEVPRTATAVPAQSVQTVNINNETGRALRAKTPHAVVEVSLPGSLTRNVFEFDANPYRRTSTSDNNGGLAKLASHGADEAQRIAELRLAASKLFLNSVVLGEKPHAVINGIVVVPGEEIMGFKLSQVSDRMVELTKDGVLLRLRM
ncbi:hypothetical protein [Poriferisphaera sp. WC338]|uniref:hypothetical protein n=1 Tax=Poriferisphaera sp. WC338 TaxID=3425129 RepID=UPI003D817E42